MDRLEAVQIFIRVAETGSFSAVAQERNTTQPTISKQIAALEAHLQTQLLVRTTRKLRLTEAGERFLEKGQRLLEMAAEVEASVKPDRKPAGLLRVGASIGLGQTQIVPRLCRFFAQYPDIAIDLQLTNRFVDLVEEGVDVAIRAGAVNDSSLIVRPIGKTRRSIVTSRRYLEKYPKPQRPEDLVNQNCLLYSYLSTGNEWHFRHPEDHKPIIVKVSGNLRLDNCLIESVEAGLGVAFAPVWLFGDRLNSPDFQILLAEYEMPASPIFAIYRRSRYVPEKTRAFINFMADEFSREPWVQ
jgi:DNA-binding transcriptional LysR family regulator